MSRRSSRNSPEFSSKNSKNIFQDLEAKLGGFCYGHDQKVARIKNLVSKHIEDYGRYKVIVKDIIKQALDFFDKRSGQFCRYHGDFANSCVGILVLAAHLAQKYDIQDEKDLIAGVLKRLFDHEGGFTRIFNILDPLTFPDEVDRTIYPRPKNDEMINTATEEYLKIMEYFLREAAHVKVRVSVRHNRWELLSTPLRSPMTMTTYASVVDAPIPVCRGGFPLLLACQSLSPEAVLLLLRYGAQPFRSPFEYNSGVLGWQFQHPLYHIIVKLNVVAAWSKHTGISDPGLLRQFKNSQACQEAHAMKCLCYFSRAMLQLPLSKSEEQARSQDTQSKCYFYLNPQHLELLPDHLWTSPAKLQHSTRCLIRKLLPPCGIPGAIKKLPLPSILKSYLDLQYD